MAPKRNESKEDQMMINGEARSKPTAWRHNNGRDSIKDKAEKQRKLNGDEAESLASAWLKFHKVGQLVPRKTLVSVVQSIAQWRQPPEVVSCHEQWHTDFIKHHDCLWKNNVRCGNAKILAEKEKFVDEDLLLREVRSQLEYRQKRAIPNENVWRIIVTTVSLDDYPLNINSLNDADKAPKNARYKKTKMITAIECINKAGGALAPLILWPHGTPREIMARGQSELGWEHARRGTGYFDAKVRDQWLRDVFNTATLSTGSPGSRVLLVGGFPDYLDSLDFCQANGIQIHPVNSHKGLLYWGPQTTTSNLREAFSQVAGIVHAEERRNLESDDFIRLYHYAREKAMSNYTKVVGIPGSGRFWLLWEEIAIPLEQPPEDVLMHDWEYTTQECTGSGTSLCDQIKGDSDFQALPLTLRKQIEDLLMDASEAIRCCGARGCVH